MEVQNILTANYLDILFDNRNKSYGGYELRNNYARRMKRSLMFVFFSVCTLIIYHAVANSFEKVPDVIEKAATGIIDTTNLGTETTIYPVLPPPPPPAAAGGAAATNVQAKAFVTPVVVDDNAADRTLPTIEDLEHSIISTQDIDGDPAGEMLNLNVSDKPGTGGNGIGKSSGNGSSIVEATDNTIHEYVSQMPKFNGNMIKYLQNNLQYPQYAIENNIDGKVLIRFVVDEEGVISHAEVLRGIGGGCDEEALRVVKNMPKWKPGMQNGKAVKVYFTLPIVFKYF